jgi:hypothetical protein
VQTILQDTLYLNKHLYQNNYFLNEMLDGWAWVMIKMMYAPYGLPAQMGEVEDWVKNVSLNGARWSNMCLPR